MKKRSPLADFVRLDIFLFLLWSVIVAASVLSAAQDNGSYQDNDTYSDRTRAASDSKSRAEQEAERMVSLSSEKIVSILQDEPGLFLQVKKLLVRKAYEQGRLLDPVDLTDEEVFRLIRRDENVRVLITRELEDRAYVRAKPSREELEREQRQMGARALTSSAV